MKIDATSADISVPEMTAEEIRFDSTSGDVNAAVTTPDVSADSTSGDVTLKVNGRADRVKAESTSGKLSVTLEETDRAEMGTTSGGIRLALSGKAESVKLHSTSGNIDAGIAAADKTEISSTSGSVSAELAAFGTLKIDSTSGVVTARLPGEPGFTCSVDTASGSFSSDLALTKDGNSYTCGDGSANAAIDTTSGDIRIEKAD